MEKFHSEELLHKSSRNSVLEQVRAKRACYLDLVIEYKSDPEICLAALLADSSDVDDHLFTKIFETVVKYVPHFSDHKPVLLRLIELNHTKAIQVYLKGFGSQILENSEFIKNAAGREGFAAFFNCLPFAVRTDAELLKLAVENVPDNTMTSFLQAIPSEALAEHEFILFHAVDRPTIHFHHDQVPSTFWRLRDFVFKCSEKNMLVPLRSIPSDFKNDRELCLSLYRSHSNRTDFVDVVRWISKQFWEDKPFVLECLRHHPKAFEYCERKLKKDFDVRLEAAFAAVRVNNSFRAFTDQLDGTLTSFAQALNIQKRPHDEFMELLACLWKSRQLSLDPLGILHCDDETTRGLTTEIAAYLGTPNNEQFVRLKCVWDEIVLLSIERTSLSNLVPLIYTKDLVHGVLKTIENNRRPVLQSYPVELWTYRSFVMCAATMGLFHEAIPVEFSEDFDICFAYYEHSPAVRHKTWHWIADTVKADPVFVFDCTSIDPLILTHSHTDEILDDYELLLNAAYHAARANQLNGLVEMARVGGWGDAFINFAETVRHAMDIQCAFKSFEVEANGRYFGEIPTASASRVTELIGSYFGTLPDSEELAQLKEVSKNHSIFFLALGGSIDDLCNINKLLPETGIAK